MVCSARRRERHLRAPRRRVLRSEELRRCWQSELFSCHLYRALPDWLQRNDQKRAATNAYSSRNDTVMSAVMAWGTPFLRPGKYRYCRTAFFAASSSRGWTDRTTVTSVTFPSTPTRARRPTTPA